MVDTITIYLIAATALGVGCFLGYEFYSHWLHTFKYVVPLNGKSRRILQDKAKGVKYIVKRSFRVRLNERTVTVPVRVVDRVYHVCRLVFSQTWHLVDRIHWMKRLSWYMIGCMHVTSTMMALRWTRAMQMMYYPSSPPTCCLWRSVMTVHGCYQTNYMQRDDVWRHRTNWMRYLAHTHSPRLDEVFWHILFLEYHVLYR